MVRTFKFRWWSCREVVVVLRGPCLLAALCALEAFAQPRGDAGIEVPLLLQRVRDDGAAGLSSGLRPGQTLNGELGLEATACPRDEHGAVCALVSDEMTALQQELAALEKGESTEGLCLVLTGLPPPQPTLEVTLSSPDGAADVGLQPSPQRVQVSGATTLRREQVFGACALLDGRPARVEVSPVRDGRQTVTIRRRPSTPLIVVVKTNSTTPVTGWLHAIPPYDWPDTSARTVPLSFVGNTATAPERVPTEPNTEFGVWSVVSVKVGKLVAAKLVAPNARQVVLTPAPPARLRLQVKAMKTPLPLARAWFEDLLPDEQGKCAARQSWGRWGELTLDGSTVATLEVPPGSRRCVFVQTASGEVAGTPAPTTPGTTVKTLQLAEVE